MPNKIPCQEPCHPLPIGCAMEFLGQTRRNFLLVCCARSPRKRESVREEGKSRPTPRAPQDFVRRRCGRSHMKGKRRSDESGPFATLGPRINLQVLKNLISNDTQLALLVKHSHQRQLSLCEGLHNSKSNICNYAVVILIRILIGHNPHEKICLVGLPPLPLI